jgi:hypothetical protein
MKKKWPRDDYTTLRCMYRRGRRKEVGDASLSVISDADCSIRGTAGGAKHWIARQTGCDDGATFRALLVPRAWASAPRGPQAQTQRVACSKRLNWNRARGLAVPPPPPQR